MKKLTHIPPRLDLAHKNTPMHKLSKLSEACGVDIFFKRDDFTGSELSGNKIRKLEFLLAEAVGQGADTVITCGGAQSNHCRATALAAARCGLNSVLLLRTPDKNDPPDIEGNILLDKLAGAEIIWVTPEEYQNRHGRFEIEAERLRSEGKHPYLIPEGGSNALGSWGYVMTMEEIAADLRAIGIDDFTTTTVISATGSGGTTAGLTLGNKIFSFGFNVIGINVCDDASYFVREITRIIEQFLEDYGVDIDISDHDINILDGYVGEGYALAGRQQLTEMYKLARLEGIILDPVYTGKAFFGMMSELKNNAGAFNERIVFIHTGGHFGLFPIARQFTPLF